MAVNVLVVDDSDVIRSMILKTLRLAEIPIGTAFEASNGREALDIINANWVDFVLADINMPVMNGIEMLSRLRADDRHLELPVIVVSTEGASERIAQLESSGVTAYVRKPFTPETIRDVVDTVTKGLAAGEVASGALQKSFIEVLERFALLGAAPAGGEYLEPDPADGDILQASMSFRGSVNGALTLAAPFDLCTEIAGNVIGAPPESDLAMQKAGDALAEVLNVTCGSLVLELEPQRQTDLQPPVVLGMDLAEWRQTAAAASAELFVVEGRPALLSCVLRPRR